MIPSPKQFGQFDHFEIKLIIVTTSQIKLPTKTMTFNQNLGNSRHFGQFRTKPVVDILLQTFQILWLLPTSVLLCIICGFHWGFFLLCIYHCVIVCLQYVFGCITSCVQDSRPSKKLKLHKYQFFVIMMNDQNEYFQMLKKNPFERQLKKCTLTKSNPPRHLAVNVPQTVL